MKNPLLKYSVERLLHEANPRGEKFFKATSFNKMIFLLHRRLLEDGVDIKLPYYWYLQGSLIDENQFNEDVGHPRQYYITSDGSTRKMVVLPKTTIPDETRQIIDRNVHNLVRNYRQPAGYFIKGYLNLLLDDVYAKAPYEFQRTFNRKFVPFLNSFKTPVQRKVPAKLTFTGEDLEKIESLLDDSLKVFPEDDMERTFTTYLEWDDTIRITIESDQQRVFPMTDAFWKFFCQDLRIKQNENLPPELIRYWDSQFTENILPKYEASLEKLRKALLKKWKQGQEEDREIDNLVTKLNLISRNHLVQSDT